MIIRIWIPMRRCWHDYPPGIGDTECKIELWNSWKIMENQRKSWNIHNFSMIFSLKTLLIIGDVPTPATDSRPWRKRSGRWEPPRIWCPGTWTNSQGTWRSEVNGFCGVLNLYCWTVSCNLESWNVSQKIV